MATLTERLALLIDADVKGAVRGLNEVGRSAEKHLGATESRADKMGRSFSKVGTKMLAAGGLAAAGLYQTVGAASDLEQAVGGTEAVFGDLSSTIGDFAKDAARDAGLSERAFREATTSIGGQLKRMTGDVDFAAEHSVELTQVAADLAATYGGTTAEAVEALGAAFRGEADPAERFNLNLKTSAVNAKAVELGLAASTSQVDDAARAQATLALIMEQSSDAQGQFAREVDSAAGSAQVAAAEFENAKAALGESLAPVMADAAGLAADLFGNFSKLNEATGGFASKAAVGVTGFTLVGGAALTAAGKVIELNRSLRDADGNLGKTGKAMKGLAGAGAALGTALVAVQALDAWAKATADNVPALEDLTASLLDFKESGELTNELLAITGDNFEDLGKKIEVAGNSPFSIFDSAGIREVHEANQQIDALDKSLAQLFARDPAAARALFDTITEAAVAQGRSVELVEDRFNDYTTAVTNASNEQRSAKGSTDKFATSSSKLAEAQKEATSAIKDATDAIKGQFDPLFAAQDALDANRDAQAAVNAAKLEALAAQEDYNKVVKEFGEKSPEATEAAWNLAAANTAIDDANRKAARSAIDVTTATMELAGEMQAGKVSIGEAEAQLGLWVKQGLLTEEQAAQTKTELGLVALAADDLSGKSINIPVDADTSSFETKIADLYRRINPRIRISVGGGGGIMLASGGPVPGPRDAPVPATVHGGEYVLPADVVDSIKRGQQPRLGGRTLPSDDWSGAGMVNNITINNPSARTAEDSLVNELRKVSFLMGW